MDHLIEKTNLCRKWNTAKRAECMAWLNNYIQHDLQSNVKNAVSKTQLQE